MTEDILTCSDSKVKKHVCWRGIGCEIQAIAPDDTGGEGWIVDCFTCQDSGGGETEQEASAEWQRIVEASNAKVPPERIYLQFDGPAPTWNDGLIYEGDVQYLRVDVVADMFLEIDLTPEQVDDFLRKHGYDPEKIADEVTAKTKMAAEAGAEGVGWHCGDPCEFCGVPHDDVAVGDCPGYPVDAKADIEPVLASAEQESKNTQAAAAKLLTYLPWMGGVIVEGIEIPVADLDILRALRDALEGQPEAGAEEVGDGE
jgi:hypothetical protein